MQNQVYFLNQNLALLLIIAVSLLFAVIGVLYSRKHQGLSNYLTAGRNVGTTSLTTSLVASALGAWILFGPASAATWGGIGSVIGYSLGTAFPMIAFIFLGTKIRKVFPRGHTLTEFIHYKFGKKLFKLILILTIFYMFIFLCAEVTAVSMLVNYISGTPLWLTSTLVIVTTLIYTLYGGLRASILTDNLQFFIVIILLIITQKALYSPWGRMMRAIRDNEEAANAMGKNVVKQHLLIFVLGSAIVGIAGAMMVTYDGLFTPGSYRPMRYTFLIWVMVIVGGSGNNFGAILGGFAVWFLWIEAAPIALFLINFFTSALEETNAFRIHLINSIPYFRYLMMGIGLLLIMRYRSRGILPEKIKHV